jgi:hypothetical protein
MMIKVSTDCFSVHRSAPTLEPEGAGHHTHRERPELTSHGGHDGCSPSAGSATLTGRDEHHIRALQGIFDVWSMRLGGIEAHVGICSSTETSRQVATDIQLDIGIRHEQCLGVGIDGNELNSPQAMVDHSVDGVHPSSTDSDDFDDR